MRTPNSTLVSILSQSQKSLNRPSSSQSALNAYYLGRMLMATKAGLDDKMTDTGNLDEILPEWEKNLNNIKIPPSFTKMLQETGKTFPHSKQVGNYLVGKMINKGSFAKVMEGLHIPTGEKVAIKVIDKRKAKQDYYVLKNMKREPRIHQMIKHPNIVQLYETLETDNSYYMVMELCLGGDLLDRICDKKRLVEQEVRRYTRQILSAVEHLHCQGIVHRDLKIENFLLDENNNIKIIDFGLSNTARFEGLSQELLHTQCGSPAYAAPELLARKKYGPKVDVWSIGVSMFAMLTGTLPFTVEPFNIKQLHQKMLIGEISPIPSDISPGAVHFMQSLLEPDPAKRPGVIEARQDKWLNEGFTRKILNAAACENSFLVPCASAALPTPQRSPPPAAVWAETRERLRVSALRPQAAQRAGHLHPVAAESQAHSPAMNHSSNN
ncbi:hormonally up-regulated neu tumor-associated kinase homolog A-like [Vidua macroura]|uniref:hormonally up-regulated neu tumor-associated kinase homolog A-like n=1 Tax=Vidua macroura TaxID=187451 RepID=UPI0023A7B88B|nr:hormonally up-regulated neu tumor-associated kinase homolog A-like [Vidua macroura]